MNDTSEPTDGHLETRIRDAISQVYLDTFGKGPLHAETFIHGDVITTVLRDVSNPAERTLVAEGRFDVVMTIRALWQHATDSAFRAAVEHVTGRRVLTVVGGFEFNADVATQVMILAPRGSSVRAAGQTEEDIPGR